MKKRFLIYIFILGLFFIPKSVFAQSYTGRASVGRSAVLDSSSNYYYTDWTLLSDNSLNSVPIPYQGGQYYHMGSEYSFPITLTGDTFFQGTVKVPVVANTIYNYTLMNGLNENDLSFGVHQNWGVYNNIILIDYTMNWECQTYPHLGVAHNYCFYVINFKFQLPDAWTGAYNLNFKVLNTTGQRSSYYYDGYDSNGNAIEFPVSSQNSGYPTLTPSVSMTSTGGSSGSNDNTEEITNAISDSTDAITDEIRESYENLVKSQEVCNVDLITSRTLSNDHHYIFYNASNASTYPFKAGTYTFVYTDIPSGIGLYMRKSTDSSNTSLVHTTNTPRSGTITITSDTDFRLWAYSSSNLSTYPNVKLLGCKNGNQAIADNIMNDTIDSLDTTSLDDIGGNMTTDTPITDLLALPITLLTAVVTGINGTCSSFNLGTLWGVGLTLPCINPELYLGSTLWNAIDLLFCGFMIYNIAQLMIHDFDSLSSAEDLFDETYTPRHEKMRRSK